MESNGSDIVLGLADLLPDEAGGVVFLAGDDPVCLQSDSPVVDSGVVGQGQLTASGEDVSGLSFSIFANGITVYHGEGAIQIDAPDFY